MSAKLAALWFTLMFKALWCHGRSSWCRPDCFGKFYTSSCNAKEYEVESLPDYAKNWYKDLTEAISYDIIYEE